MLSERIGLALDNTEKPLRKLFDKWCAADATAFTAAEVTFAGISPFARLRKANAEKRPALLVQANTMNLQEWCANSFTT